MFRGMFARLLAVVLAIVLVCVLALFSLFYVTMRANAVDARLGELKTQAYDLAYLASRMRNSVVERSLGVNEITERYIKWKASRIYEVFRAYSVVLDRTGVSIYADWSDQTLFALYDQKEVERTLKTVLAGQEVVFTTESEAGPLFTVAVPWIDNETVLGAVYIQTSAQTIYAAYQPLAAQVALAAVAVFALAGVCVFFFTRQIVKPLRVMAHLTGEMAQGRFDCRVPVTGSRETRELAAAFNGMAEQLDALEKTRRDFVANVSHELRSPMTSMQGFLQGMLDGTIPPEDTREYMQIVLDETRRLSKLVGGLLNLSRMENNETALAYTDFDLHELIRRVIIANMSQLDDKRLEVQLSFDDESLFVHADCDQIEQVLINLLSNAVKYTPADGHIWMDTAQADKTVRVTVRDDGQGIPPEDAPYIFERFYKADKAHTVGKGTGLGLAICKRIMERHGQAIRLLPCEQGAAFEFTLAAGHAPALREDGHAHTGTGEN